ncbi:SANT and BTB domain regulator of class switch recombination-like isoform X2 [Haliotis cracherodii]|uniref:SANT and BTB domain regulator of class switch recombination-like isoform X2 n=1 Tax=Haliotis cracherodii TaxID=6455 RepID=UPI0039EB4888
MSTIEPSSRVGVTLDLILKTLIASADFNDLQTKNWEAIARLIPGTTATQCSRRYQELLSSGTGLSYAHFGKTFPLQTASSSSQVNPTESDSTSKTTSSTSSRLGSDRQKGVKEERGNTEVKGEPQNSEHGEHGPIMVIHVCDEAKSLKKDFNCPRDLLVKEMKYFAEYLSTDAQRWEEVDISVHCDVQIFDWLMKYVKRSTKDVPDKPRLEPNNVVSILISSDFLKMDNLVQECIEYCHKQMSSIVATNCNMNCINDKLVTRIADLFTHSEADEIKDRKDKFKSKLFSKKLEKLFDVENTSPDSLESAVSLFKCSICKRHLTSKLEKKVKCVASRMTVNKRGGLTYCHVRDTTFDLNDYLLDLKSQMKYWRDVYWRVWGTINSLACSRCGETFPLTEFGHCKYHPEAPRYDNEGTAVGPAATSCVGLYPCCHQKTMRFDPVQLNKGCRVKDHIINLTEATPGGGDLDTGSKSPLHKVYDDLLAHRDVICVPYQRLPDTSEAELNIFGNEVFASRSRSSGVHISKLSSPGEEDKKIEHHHPKPQPRLQALTVEREVSFEIDEFAFGESDDEIGDEESLKGSVKKPRATRKSRVTIDPQAILLDAPGFEQTKKSTWDTQRSMRYNQDAQRQEDQRRMKDIRLYLTKLRLKADRIDKPKREFSGGIFSKLEAQWKMANTTQPTKQQGQTQARHRMGSGQTYNQRRQQSFTNKA